MLTTVPTAPLPTTPAPTAGSTAKLAGAAYVGAWLVGLAVRPSGPDLLAAPEVIARHYGDHGTTAAASSLLVHGVAAAALATVVVAVHRRQPTPTTADRVYVSTAAVAVIVSLAQLLVGLVLALLPDVGRVDVLFDALNRLDGVKLLLLAAAALAATRLDLPRWVRRLGVPLALTLVGAGIGFLVLDSTLALVAAPALVLLLVWVAASGVSAAR